MTLDSVAERDKPVGQTLAALHLHNAMVASERLILRSFVYLFVLLLFQACQYLIIVFHLNAPLSTAAFAMGHVTGIVTNVFYSPVTRAYLYPVAACTILCSLDHG